MEGRPKDVDDSDGRFLALYDGYLDTAIYTRGREVAVAGDIRGKKVLPLGQIDYTYPFIFIKEIHLFTRSLRSLEPADPSAPPAGPDARQETVLSPLYPVKLLCLFCLAGAHFTRASSVL